MSPYRHSLELNIHQLILSDLAANVGHCKGNTSIDDLSTSIDLITSQVETRAVEEEDAEHKRAFMVSYTMQCYMSRVFMDAVQFSRTL